MVKWLEAPEIVELEAKRISYCIEFLSFWDYYYIYGSFLYFCFLFLSNCTHFHKVYLTEIAELASILFMVALLLGKCQVSCNFTLYFL